MNKKKKTNEKSGYFNERNIMDLSGEVRGELIGVKST